MRHMTATDLRRKLRNSPYGSGLFLRLIQR
jgi:hypothetical protein